MPPAVFDRSKSDHTGGYPWIEIWPADAKIPDIGWQAARHNPSFPVAFGKETTIFLVCLQSLAKLLWQSLSGQLSWTENSKQWLSLSSQY